MPPTFDRRDQAIVAARAASLDADGEPRVGDYVVFADGVTRRIGERFDFGTGEMPDIQTAAVEGSFHLCAGYVRHGGSLHLPVHRSTLTRTDEQCDGRVWIFHHGHSGAGRDVSTRIPFRVYTCCLDAPL